MSKSSATSAVPVQKFQRGLLVALLILIAMRAALGVWVGFDLDDAGSVAAGLAVAAILMSSLDRRREKLWLIMGGCGVVIALATWIAARTAR